MSAIFGNIGSSQSQICCSYGQICSQVCRRICSQICRQVCSQSCSQDCCQYRCQDWCQHYRQNLIIPLLPHCTHRLPCCVLNVMLLSCSIVAMVAMVAPSLYPTTYISRQLRAHFTSLLSYFLNHTATTPLHHGLSIFWPLVTSCYL